MKTKMLLRGARSAVSWTLIAWASLVILTTGPRSVLGHTGPSSDVAVDRAGAPDEAVTDAVADDSVTDDIPEVLWDVLAGLDFNTGEVSAELQPFVDKEVKIPGYMVPLEDFSSEVSEFLLVPYVGACVHTPPPPPNQLVYVKMKGDEKVTVSFWDPIWIVGTLEIEETTNVYGSVSFRMAATALEPYEW